MRTEGFMGGLFLTLHFGDYLAAKRGFQRQWCEHKEQIPVISKYLDLRVPQEHIFEWVEFCEDREAFLLEIGQVSLRIL